MQKVKSVLANFREYIFHIFIRLVLLFVISALSVQILFVTLELTGKSDLASKLATEIMWRIDGTFKNSPQNIWYDEDNFMWVESVVNNVKIGKLAGNRQLEFGVKNILEEFLQEKEYELSPSSKNKLKVEIVYLDVLTTKKNVSVFHKNEEEVVIRMKGILLNDGKKIKEVLVEESSSEISMSTLIIDEGGKFNQTSLSNAIKKSCDKLISKLTEK